MSLSKQAIDEFKAIYKKEFKEEISDEDARERAERLIRLYRAVYYPTSDDYKEEG